jgi:hypothetical protein
VYQSKGHVHAVAVEADAAITRCINRFIFVETVKSHTPHVGGVFLRWLQCRGFADRCTMLGGTQQSRQGPGTDDPRRVEGARRRAHSLTVSSTASNAAVMFDQAVYCFQLADSPACAPPRLRARRHLKLCEFGAIPGITFLSAWLDCKLRSNRANRMVAEEN